jgi:hypothetical protein
MGMSMNRNRGQPPERPRAEPEIIPPGGDAHARRGPAGLWVRIEERDGVRRVTISRPGLPTIVLGLLLLGLIAALAFLVLAGFLLFWIPVLIAGLLLGLAAVKLRDRWQRLQARWSRPR